MCTKDDPESAQRSDARRGKSRVPVLLVTALLARQSQPAHRQQCIFHHRVDTHDVVAYGSVATDPLLELLGVGVPHPAPVTPHRLRFRFFSGKRLPFVRYKVATRSALPQLGSSLA